MFIESCKHCGEVFASVRAKSSHFQECSSLPHDDLTIEDHSEIPSESQAEATVSDITDTPKRKEKRMNCLFCGQLFGHGFELKHHLKSCQKLEDNVDVDQRKCLHCQVIIEGSFKYHFQLAHSDLDFVKQNRTKCIKREKHSHCAHNHHSHN